MTKMMSQLGNLEFYTVNMGRTSSSSAKGPKSSGQNYVCRNLQATFSPLIQIIKSLDMIFKVLIKPSFEKDYVKPFFKKIK